MAAELLTLASSFLDTEPENYASLLLECIDTKLYLNGNITCDDWVGRVNSLLNSKNERWLGVCLLEKTVEQCDTETFTRNCLTWIRAVIQIIQVPAKKSVIQCCSQLLEVLLKHAAEFPELSRELSNSVIPSLVSNMLFGYSVDAVSVLSILTSCIHWFPGPVRPFQKHIETFLVPSLSSSHVEAVKAACHCYAMLARCSSSETIGSKQHIGWETQWLKVLNSVHKLLDVAYENVEPAEAVPSQRDLSETLPLVEIPQTEPSRTHGLVTQCNNLLLCMSEMIKQECRKVVTLPIDATVWLLTRILVVSGNSLKTAVALESVLLRASLPLIHKNAVDLLRNLVTRCGTQLLPYCDVLVKFLVQELTWTRSHDPKYGQGRPFGNLRCSVYSCIQHWVQCTNNLSQEAVLVTKLIHCIMEDIKPLSSHTKLLCTTKNRTESSKKAKKRKIQEDVDQLVTGHHKLDERANETVTYRALKALSATLISSGGDIPNEVFKEIQACVVELILQIQRSVHNSYPIPYGIADCRQELYHVLLSCILTHSAQVPSPINFAVRLFSSGLQDINLKVSSFCQEALAVTNSVIHPRSFPHMCSVTGPLTVTASESPLVSGLSYAEASGVTQICTTGNGEISQEDNILCREKGVELSLQCFAEPQDPVEVQNAVQSVTTASPVKTVGSQPAEMNSQPDEVNTSAWVRKTGHSTTSNGMDRTEGDIAVEQRNDICQSNFIDPESARVVPSGINNVSPIGLRQIAESVEYLRTSPVVDGTPYQNNADGVADNSEPRESKKTRIDGDNSATGEKNITSALQTISTGGELESSNKNTENINVEDDDDEAEKLLAVFVDSYPDSDEPELE